MTDGKVITGWRQDRQSAVGAGVLARPMQAVRRHWGFLAVVVVPTLALAVYYFGFAADQYQSEAHFLVRSSQPTPAVSSNLGQVLGLGPGLSSTQSEAYSVSDYLTSQDALAAVDRKLDLAQVFRRPEADVVSRLWSDHPAAESLLKYYRRHVSVVPNQDTSVTILRVTAFRPQDARNIAELLLELGEQRVNALNTRVEAEAIRAALDEQGKAEQQLAEAQGAITAFRAEHRDADPEKSEVARLGVAANLRQQLAEARAQRGAMAAYLRPDSPQMLALDQRIGALNAQTAAQDAALSGGGPGAIAPSLAQYDQLKFRQEFAATRYAAAAAALSNARAEALKQQLFVVRVVEPNLPQKALYPRRWLLVASAFAGLLLAYGIGWLIMAGVREHAG
jgi:capsular polysaccharide transport system permease protein